MDESIEELKNKIARIESTSAVRDRRIASVERTLREAISTNVISKQVDDINQVLQGKDGKNGLRGSVNRLLMLIDGSEQYCIVGIMDQIQELHAEVAKLVTQRNQIKWGIVGILSVTTLGNANSILLLIKSIFGM